MQKKKKKKQANQLLILPLKMFMELCLRVLDIPCQIILLILSFFHLLPSVSFIMTHHLDVILCSLAIFTLSSQLSWVRAWIETLLHDGDDYYSIFLNMGVISPRYFFKCCRSSPPGSLGEASRNFNDSSWSRFLWKRGSLCGVFLFCGQFPFSFSFRTDRAKVARL